MPLSRLEIARSALVFFVLAGCSSAKPRINDQTDDNEKLIVTLKDDELYTGIPEDKIKTNDADAVIQDSEVDFGSERDAEKVAIWTTQRKKMISWCLDQRSRSVQKNGEYRAVFPDRKPPVDRLDQAISIGMRVVDKVPEANRERGRLAEGLFIKGSNEYFEVDQKIKKLAEYEDKNKADSAEAKRLKEEIDAHGNKLAQYHLLALKHFKIFLGAFPDDRNTLDFMWKIHFELGDFREAVKVMNVLLDSGKVPDTVRVEYEAIRREINDYLVAVQIDKKAPKPGMPKPPQDGG